MLNEDGTIYDDVVVFHIAETVFWISTLHISRPTNWLEKNKGSLDVAFKDITPEWEMFAVQGPKSRDIVNQLVANPVDAMKFFRIEDNSVGKLPIKVATAGYTGEKCGYELYVAKDQKDELAAKIDEAAAAHGGIKITEVDVMAYTLAAEKGLVLITDIYDANPFEVDLDRFINWDKDFVGKKALRNLKDNPLTRKLLGVTGEDKEARVYGGPKGAKVYINSEQVGKVTKFTYGFTVDKWVGYVMANTAKVGIGDKVIINNVVEGVITERPILK
jgi:aminomethyltransferase